MIPVILSGGSGHGLRPISRKETPKQFCQFLNEPLLELTLKRLNKLQAPLVLSNINLKIPTENVLNKLNFPVDVIYEPLSRNTAPAVALAAKYLTSRSLDNEWVCVFPSDHIIKDTSPLFQALDNIKHENDDFIYLLGIKPNAPKTGFGYIELESVDYNKACAVKNFHEKPTHETASRYIQNDHFFWNSGIFVFKPKTLIKHFEKTNNSIWSKINQITSFQQFTDIYEKVMPNSFDYDVLENFSNIKCTPIDLDWSDVGTWDEFSKVVDQEFSYENELISLNSKNNYFLSNTKKAIVTIDVNDLIVIDTPDSLLICQKGSSEQVKRAVSQITNKVVVTNHNFELKPWGSFNVLLDEPHQKVKKITVFPNQQLSYQSHKKRSEHWTITKGMGTVTLQGVKTDLKVGQSIFIPALAKHRISNIGDKTLEFIEVQTGTYFGEDDIIRYEDDYGRATHQQTYSQKLGTPPAIHNTKQDISIDKLF